MSPTFEFYVVYSQFAVYDPELDEWFNDWTETQVAQGFTWYPRSVSFGTLVDSYPLRVEVRQAATIELLPEAVRAIRVPFEVGPRGRVGLSNVADWVFARVPPGSYALIFESGYLSDDIEDGTWIRLSFVPQTEVEPAILRADAELQPPEELDMFGRPAV